MQKIHATRRAPQPKLDKNKSYIVFFNKNPRERDIFEHGIAIRAGQYTHSEFLVGNTIYAMYTDGVKKYPFVYEPFMHVYELATEIKPQNIVNEFSKVLGATYDFVGVLFSQLFEFGIHKKGTFFCSELCMHIIDTVTGKKFTHKGKKIKPNEFSPMKLYHFLKENNLIVRRVA